MSRYKTLVVSAVSRTSLGIGRLLIMISLLTLILIVSQPQAVCVTTGSCESAKVCINKACAVLTVICDQLAY